MDTKIFNKISFAIKDPSKFSFGTTSGIITSLALIVGLGGISNPKTGIIGALLLLAIADNISDSLGIHIYRESQAETKNTSNVHTASNFLARLAVTLTFVLLILFLPMDYALLASLFLGLFLLSMLSYIIAVQQKINPYLAILQHLGVAVAVLAASHFLGQIIISTFSSI